MTDVAAGADVAYPAGVWTLYLNVADWGSDCDVEVGAFDGSSFNAFAASNIQSAYSNGILMLRLTTESSNIPEGSYLAVRITNHSGSGYTVITDGTSYLVTTENGGAYPLPELSALALLGMGLAGIAAVILIRRKKTIQTNVTL